MPMNRRVRLLFTLATVLAGSWPAAARAQLVPPPQGKAITVEVARGGSVAIPLAGSDRKLRDLRFGIDRGPRHGRLGSITSEGPRKASVTYTHGDDEDSVQDSFVYSVKAGTGGTGRATVTIKVVDAAPVLAAPATVDFGEVVLGETPIKSFQLANLGGGVIEGNVALPPPFHLETPGDFSLRRGKSRDFAVSFAPARPGEFMHRVSPSPSDGSVVVFRGRALEPFQARPASTVLAADADDTRATSVLITNLALTNLVIRITGPEGTPVRMPREVAVAAGGTATVELMIPASEKGAVPDFTVAFASPDYSSEWQFSAPSIPARLEILAPPDFGEVEPGRTAEAVLAVRNTGGTHGHLRMHLGPLIRPVESTEAIDLAPAETREVKLKMRLKKDQQPPAEIPLEFNGAKASVPVLAGRTAEAAAPAEAHTAQTPTPAATPAMEAPPLLTGDPKVTLTRAAGGIPRLEWTPEPGWTDYRLHRNGTPFSGYTDMQLTWWQSLLATPGRIAGFFTGLVSPAGRPRPADIDPFAVGQASASSEGLDLLPAEIGAPVIWQLMARRHGETAEAPVGARFHVGPQGVHALPDAKTAPTTATRGQRISSERTGALVQLFITRDPSITSFKLERGHLVIQPEGVEFIPVSVEDMTSVQTSVGEAATADGKLTILSARIDGLAPGSATAWRAVPVAGERPLPPTQLMIVRTEPDPPFPWTTLGISLAAAILAVLVYMRWRMSRPES
jgi:hypothetical protein